ncbi:hypothetical protein FSP39_020348 [Pinctada imbricata]|uniref:Uncharacterized protein n=1 Tax=Pinctada imbricata TaxID=66713 RepID=A0AA88YCG5_PINIB|nr:hypothetical protein FSP39_020348 [Pinctada imbricata]
MDVSCQYSYTRGDGMDGSINIFNTISETIKRHSKNPQKVAHVYVDWQTGERKVVTFKGIYDRATEIGYGLLEMDIEKGDIVALGTENIPEWMYATIGIQMCGAIPLHFVFNRKDGKDVEDVLKIAGTACKAIIFPPGKDDVNLSVVEKICKPGFQKGNVVSETIESIKWAALMSMYKSNDVYPCMSDIIKKGHSTERCFPRTDPDDVMGLLMTSGSSGVPKLVPVSHRNMLTNGYHLQYCYGLSSEISLNDRPFCWNLGYPSWEIFTGSTRVIVQGVTEIQSMPEYFEVVKKIIKSEKCNAALLITPILHEFLSKSPNDIHLDTVFTGGQSVPAKFADLTKSICNRFVNGYGCTEIGGLALKEVYRSTEYLDSEVGVPFEGVEIKVVDAEENLVKCGDEGQLMVRSPNQFLGYWNNAEKTDEVYSKSRWYKTGDLSQLTTNGSLIVTGRISDSMIKIGPRFVSTTTLETKLNNHPAIEDAIVIPLVDEMRDHSVCCAIVARKGKTLTKEMIDDYLLDLENRTEQNFLQTVELPKNYVFLDTFPCTARGKFDRKKIMEICKNELGMDKSD